MRATAAKIRSRSLAFGASDTLGAGEAVRGGVLSAGDTLTGVLGCSGALAVASNNRASWLAPPLDAGAEPETDDDAVPVSVCAGAGALRIF